MARPTYDPSAGRTSCCGAEATYVEHVLCCKVCYRAVDGLFDEPREEPPMVSYEQGALQDALRHGLAEAHVDLESFPLEAVASFAYEHLSIHFRIVSDLDMED